MDPAAICILIVSALGALIAGAAFVWAARRGEFTDGAQAAFLVFDDEDEPPAAGGAP